MILILIPRSFNAKLFFILDRQKYYFNYVFIFIPNAMDWFNFCTLPTANISISRIILELTSLNNISYQQVAQFFTKKLKYKNINILLYLHFIYRYLYLKGTCTFNLISSDYSATLHIIIHYKLLDL